MQFSKFSFVLLSIVLFFGAFGCSHPSDKKKSNEQQQPNEDAEKPSEPKTQNEKEHSSGNETLFATSDAIRSTKGHFFVHIEWLDPLSSKNLLKAKLIIANNELHAPDSVKIVGFEPFMPSMGHGTDMSQQKIVQSSDHQELFNVSGIRFSMGGPWEIRLTAEVDGQTDLAIIHVQVP